QKILRGNNESNNEMNMAHTRQDESRLFHISDHDLVATFTTKWIPADLSRDPGNEHFTTKKLKRKTNSFRRLASHRGKNPPPRKPHKRNKRRRNTPSHNRRSRKTKTSGKKMLTCKNLQCQPMTIKDSKPFISRSKHDYYMRGGQLFLLIFNLPLTHIVKFIWLLLQEHKFCYFVTPVKVLSTPSKSHLLCPAIPVMGCNVRVCNPTQGPLVIGIYNMIRSVKNSEDRAATATFFLQWNNDFCTMNKGCAKYNRSYPTRRRKGRRRRRKRRRRRR
ncbi:Hypothetical predicted protein, partial [Paramuricea clavata]